MRSRLVLIIVVCIIVFFIIYINNKIIQDKNCQLFSILNQNLKAIGNIDLSGPINTPVYYINLDKSEDRKSFMEDQFKKYNITDYKRVAGVLGSSLPSKKRGTYQEISYVNHDARKTKAEIGCTLAHLKAIKQSYNDGHEMVLILEDDTVLDLVPFWDITSLRSLSEDAPDDWEILQLHTAKPTTKSKWEKFNPKNPLWTTAAYMINKKGMKNILNKTTNEYSEIVIKPDGVADFFIYHNANTYVYYKSLFIIGDNLLPSTIHNQFVRSLILGDHREVGHIKRCNEIIKSYI